VPLHLVSLLVRCTAVVVPIAAAAGTGIALARLLDTPEGPTTTVLWLLVIIGGSMTALVLVDRAARQLLPLSVLLRLSLAFPARAPSRLGVALRGARRRSVAGRIETPRTAGGESLGADEVVRLGAALSAHDRRTRGHTERVRALTEPVAQELGLPPEHADRLRWAAFLHDIGKLPVPSNAPNGRVDLDAEVSARGARCLRRP
jgi:HD-GYP domain-containing protein (c-di-GMP phosphodiesterase class II)